MGLKLLIGELMKKSQGNQGSASMDDQDVFAVTLQQQQEALYEISADQKRLYSCLERLCATQGRFFFCFRYFVDKG